ncbi:UdgX family uracil-DNA binding protein [Parafrigoribacterium soli]|uniref:UdgX family uracil-DNA binding protein n=1 Tax=Parafrigoribacterium soli TaxID=3144663 RepID=UPI0032EFF9A5
MSAHDVDRPGAERWVPDGGGVRALRRAAPACRGCELWAGATQVVFSTGSASARLMLVGEQPGDREDREGAPFVGPAGRLLDDALDAAGIDRGEVYLTNAVKHFRFEERGKRRMHKNPAVAHIEACAPWLRAELAAVKPDVVVCLGATAGRAVLGRPVRVGQDRGHLLDGEAHRLGRARVLLTAHPSAVVRLHDRPEFDEAFDLLVADLSVAATLLAR